MYVYLDGERARAAKTYDVTVAPAGDIEFTNPDDCPADWKNPDGAPMQIVITFEYGRAVVDENMGRYLVKRGIAQRNALIRVGRGLVGLTP